MAWESDRPRANDAEVGTWSSPPRALPWTIARPAAITSDDSGGGGASYDEGTFGRDQTIAMESLSANGLSDDLREQQTLEVYSKGAISHQSNAAPTVNVAELAAAMAEIGASFTSAEAREGYAALTEKRAPVYDDV